MASSAGGSSSGVTEQEFTVRVPNSQDNKTFHVMKFNASYKIDFSSWSQVRMVRENNQKVFSTHQTEEEPKFGAGSAFGKEAKEEARRKKLGIVARKYKVEDQPWLMRIGGKGGKKFKGTREGGVAENTTYYVFTHGKDGSVEAFPVSDWYNFTPIQRYKTLDADEAEEKYAQRGKVLNKWAVMVHRKLKPATDEDLDGEDGDKKKSKGKKDKDFKISDMDDWEGDEDGLDTESDKEKGEDSDDEGKNKNKNKNKDTKKKNRKKKKGEEDDEAFEDSDDGDDEGREVDYMSDESSDSEADLEKEAEVKGVDQDEGLSKMLDSESSSEDEEKKKKKEEEEEEEDGKGGKKKRKRGSAENSRENSDDEGGKKKGKKGSNANSRANTPTPDTDKSESAAKRKALVANILDPNADGGAQKKSRLEQFGSSSSGGGSVAGNEAISEDSVRRYLKRRPMTTTDLLKKFRSKKTGIQNAQLVQLLAHILKKINPHKQKVKGVTYLSLKEGQ